MKKPFTTLLMQLSHMRSSTGRTDISQAAACIMQYTGYTSVAEGWINDAIRFWNQQRSGSTRISQTRTSDGSKPRSIYSLNGNRRDTLQKGIYIVDGRKSLVK